MRTFSTLLLGAALVGCRTLPDRQANSAEAAGSAGAPPMASLAPIIVEHSRQRRTPAAPSSAEAPAAADSEEPPATSEEREDPPASR